MNTQRYAEYASRIYSDYFSALSNFVFLSSKRNSLQLSYFVLYVSFDSIQLEVSEKVEILTVGFELDCEGVVIEDAILCKVSTQNYRNNV